MNEVVERQDRGRWLVARKFLLALLVVAVVTGVFSLGRLSVQTIAPASVLSDRDTTSSVYTVATGSVEEKVELAASAQWPVIGVLRIPRDGVLTSVSSEPGRVVSYATGSQIASVNLEPVHVLSGDVPAFRTLEVGVRGPDVQQLQEALVHVAPPAVRVDGIFDDATRRALTRWQGTLGVDEDGVANLGEIVFVPGAGPTLSLDSEVSVGDRMGSDVVAFRVHPPEPEISLLVPSELVADVAAGTVATVVLPSGKVLRGSVGEMTQEAGSSTLRASFRRGDGAPLCPLECAVLPADESTALRAEVVLISKVTGPVVPVAAMRSNAAGQVEVALTSGEMVRVHVRAVSDGVAVVSGLESGAKILISDDA